MSKENIYKLTNPQESIWNMELFFKNTTVNNICVSGTIYEDINIEFLKKAVNETVKQNDAFRTRIIMEKDVPMQYISDYKEFDIDVVTVLNEQEVKLIEQEEVKYKFNIIDSDLYKFKIVCFGNNFATVILNAHHIIADSWAMGLVIQEIIKNYHKLVGVSDFEVTTSSYIDYINSEEEYRKSKKLQKDKEYWKDVFTTVPKQATIPSSISDSQTFSYKAKRTSFKIDADLLDKINEYCTLNKISNYAFFMSVFAIYVKVVSNIDDFVIGTPILNRTNFKEKHTIGMFVNTAPVRFTNIDNFTFKAFSNDASQKIIGILRHQKYSYNNILNDLRTKNQNVPNLYNVALSYQITKAFDQNLGNYKTNWTFNNYCGNDFNIHILDINDTGSLIINYDYLIEKYSEKEVINMQNRIIHIINQVILNPDIECKDIEIVTPNEKDEILNIFNNTYSDYPRDKTIADLFEEQAEKMPNNIAIVFDDEKMTYEEVNKKANKLARYLQEKGVKSQDKVVILADKSIDLYIAIIAILKLGALYVPVDNEYPEERIKVILEDCKPKVIVVDDKYKSLVKGQNLCTLPLKNIEKYEDTNIERNITARRWCIYNIYFWLYRKTKRCNCTT